jgi:hypothetical protein
MAMKARPISRAFVMVVNACLVWGLAAAPAGELSVSLGESPDVISVGAIRRWDDGGKPRFPVDPKAKIESPRVDAWAQRRDGGRWIFPNLAGGTYDLVILASPRIRVEGFRYPPITEFDPFLAPDAKPPDDETRETITKDIVKARHYENKVTPLYLAGGDKQVRILVQLVRDQPTSFDGDFGAPVATVRHEIWQYANNYGGWVKDRRTEVIDRVLMAKSEFHRWTWVWEPKLGGIEVGKKAASASYELPRRFDSKTSRGWFPD